MSLIVVGLNHRTVPVDLLERMTVPEQQLAKALHDLAAREHLLEVVVLSTCNRTEIYARCTRFHAAVGDVRDFLAVHSGAHPDEFAEHLYTYYDDAAVAHLFAVAAGLDSMIVGGVGDPRPGARGVGDVAARRHAAATVEPAVPARGRVGQARSLRDRHRASPGVDPVGGGARRDRAPRHPRRRARPRHRRGQHGQRTRVDAEVARGRAGVDREPDARARRDTGRPNRRHRDPAHRRRRHARRHRCGAHLDGIERGAGRALDGRDGDGMPGRRVRC